MFLGTGDKHTDDRSNNNHAKESDKILGIRKPERQIGWYKKKSKAITPTIEVKIAALRLRLNAITTTASR